MSLLYSWLSTACSQWVFTDLADENLKDFQTYKRFGNYSTQVSLVIILFHVKFHFTHVKITIQTNFSGKHLYRFLELFLYVFLFFMVICSKILAACYCQINDDIKRIVRSILVWLALICTITDGQDRMMGTVRWFLKELNGVSVGSSNSTSRYISTRTERRLEQILVHSSISHNS